MSKYRVIVSEGPEYLFFWEISDDPWALKEKFQAKYPDAEIELSKVVDEAELAHMITEVSGAY